MAKEDKPAENKPAGATPSTGPASGPAKDPAKDSVAQAAKTPDPAAASSRPRAEILDPPAQPGPPTPGSPTSSQATPNRDRPRMGPLIDAAPGDVRREDAGKGPDAIPRQADQPQDKSTPDRSTPGKSTPDMPAQKATAEENRAQDSRSQEKPRAGVLAPLLAGAAGAMIALAGAGGYTWMTAPDPAKTAAAQAEQVRTLVESTASKERAAFETRLKTEQDRINKQSTAMSTALAALSQRIAAVESLAGQAASAAGGVKEDIARLQTRPASPAIDIGPFETRISALEKRLAAAESALAAPKTEARVTEDRSIAPQQPAAPGTAPAAPDLAPLQQRLAQLEARPQTRPADLTPLMARLTALEERLAPLARQIEPLERRLAPVEKQITPLQAGLDKTQAQSAANAQAIAQERGRTAAAALAVVSRSLTDALRSGARYDNLLQAAQALGADQPQIAALKPFAETGAPDAAAMVKSLALAEQKIAQRKPPPPADEPLFDKLKRNLLQQVQIRPIDSSGQTAPGGSVAALAEAVKRGEFARAVKLADILPEQAARPLAPWTSQLRQLAAAHEAAQILHASALARLTQEQPQ